MRRQWLDDFLRRRPYALDIALPLGMLVLAAPVDGSLVGGASLFLDAGLIGPLVLRRRYPTLTFALVSLFCVFQLVLIDIFLFGDTGFLVALYAMAVHAPAQRRRLALTVATLAPVFGAVDWVLLQPGRGSEGALVLGGLLGALVALTWTFGNLTGTRRAYVGELEERARRLEVERDQQAVIAAAAERNRIAREMHDVVAHSLSVVIAQADGGLYASRTDPALARRALETIGVTGREALAEMRRLLGVLRTDDGTAVLAPQPGLDQLGMLVGQVRRAGLPVRLEVRGHPPELTAGVELAVYRVCQEALTNVLKHAGPDATATVTLEYATDRLRLRVSDDGVGDAADSDGHGQGLRGMRERVAVYGGDVVVRPRATGGFEVVATVPYPRLSGAAADR